MSTKHPGATKLNAEAIRDLCDRVAQNLISVTVALMAAVDRAENDYDHNADQETA